MCARARTGEPRRAGELRPHEMAHPDISRLTLPILAVSLDRSGRGQTSTSETSLHTIQADPDSACPSSDSNAPNQPPPPHASFSSSAGSSSSSMSSSLSPANHPSERTLSAALRGDYPNDPSPSASSNNIPALGAPTTGSTYRDHDDTRMSVDAQPSSHPYAAQSNQYSSQPQGGQPHQQQQQQQQPPYPMAASSSTAPPVPYGGSGAAPAVQLAAEQLSAAQAALRQAEEQTRVAKMNAAVAQAKESGQQAQPPAAAQVKIRKTAGKYALKDFQIERT